MFNEKIYLTDDKVAWLDCYVLDGNAKRDAMLIIPGGGYSGVSHFLEGEPIAVAFLEKGYNCFVLNYHVGKGQNYPTQLIDASLAMLYIKNNCEKYQVNLMKIFPSGKWIRNGL